MAAPRPFASKGPAKWASTAAFCAEERLDFAFVPPASASIACGWCTMDMDSTLITIECVDEIADMQGLKPQVAAITAAAMRGEIDFAESLVRRVALLAGLDVSALERVYAERLALSPGAERMLASFRKVGAKTLLVSGGFTFFTDRLKERLGLDYTVSNTLEIVDGKLTGRIEGPIVDASVKADRLRKAACRVRAWRRPDGSHRRRGERFADAGALRISASPITRSLSSGPHAPTRSTIAVWTRW